MIKTVVMVYDQAFISGGAAKIAIMEALELKKRGYNVIYFTAVGEISQELKKSNIKVIHLNEKHIATTKNPVSLLKGIWNINAKKKFIKLLENLNKDTTIIHIQGWTKALSSSIFYVANKMNFKTIITLHEYFTICPNGGIFNYKRNKICTLKPGSSKCMFCNCDKRNYVQKIYRDVRHKVQTLVFKKSKPSVIYITEFSKKILKDLPFCPRHTYDLTNFVEIEKKNRILCEENNHYIFIGRISSEKGIDVFCEAITRSNNRGIVIGEGPLKEEYKKLYPEIEFVGWKSTIEMQQYLYKARAMIVASKWYETMGLTAVEMQQYGIPCIIPKECAVSEYVADGKTGLLYEIGNVDDLTDKINMLNDDLTKKFSIEFYNQLNLEKYSIKTHVDNLEEIYDNEIVC